MALTYTTQKRDRKPLTLTFDLDGVTYTARRPKDALSAMVLAASSDQASTSDIMYATFNWIDAALPEAEFARLKARLRDYDDDFDIEQLLNITVDVIKQFDQMTTGQTYRQSPNDDPAITAPPADGAAVAATVTAMGGAKRRGRPPGSKNKPKDVIEGQVVTSPARVSRSLPR